MCTILAFIKPEIKLDVWAVLIAIWAVLYIIGKLIKGKDIFERIADALGSFLQRAKGIFFKKGKDDAKKDL